jgi:putative PIN family toxin of toxin-antitoxin system
MAKFKIVLDTNIIVSALLTSGPTLGILKLWREGKFDLILSDEIFEEYYAVFSREKFCLPSSLIKTIIDEFRSKALWFNKTSQINLIKEDPSDNKFIETALDGKADYIISGDFHLLKIKKYQTIVILLPQEFLAKF